ncbi:MAG: Hsp70 family protein [Polyangiaceae bacterium]
MSETIVGVDLGTTNSLVGAVIDGEVTLFADPSGNALLPSVVGVGSSGEILVGRTAKNRRVLDPEGTVVSVKRLMGTDAKRRVGDRELSAPQISALILGALLDRAEARLGARPGQAVITVPAYFTDGQRQATRDAGELAGLRVERLVNEPTAAAMTYRTGEEQLVLVYDLGGGTFDVSILERDADFLEVRASHGDTRLGGDDIDGALTDLVLGRLGDKRGAVEADARARTRLLEAVERAKIALSDREEVRLYEPFLAGDGADGVHLDLPLTRADLDSIARPFIERTLGHIDMALRDAKVRPVDLDRVLLVGGASKMPIVRSLVSAHLERPAQVDLDADRAVAFGATMLAGRAAGATITQVLVDITPHTLAAGVLDAPDDAGPPDLVAAPIIERGTVIPTVRKRTVYTGYENQHTATIPIVQGEHRLAELNTQLGEVVISHIPPSRVSSPVEVTYRLDLSGVLHVSAEHLPSGTSASVQITNSPYRLTEQHRAAAKAEIEELRAGASEGHADETATETDLSLARAMLTRAEKALAKGGDTEAHQRVRAAISALQSAASKKSSETATLTDALSDALLDLL